MTRSDAAKENQEGREPADGGMSAHGLGTGPRERILEAARRQFFSLGFARFTMDDLAAELGMSKKTLYRHFRSKDKIIDALIDAKAHDIRAGFDEIFGQPDTTFFERVGLFVQHIHVQLGEISTVFFRDLQRFAPESFAHLDAVRSNTLPKVWQRLLSEGMAAGAIRSDLNVEHVAQIVLTCVRALVGSESLERLRLAPHEVVERFFDMIFAGILTPAGQQAYENNRPKF